MGPILILTRTGDAHATHVAGLLARRGAEVIVFDTAQFPARASLSFAISGGAVRRRLTTAAQVVDLDAVTAIWFRLRSDPVPHASVVDPTARLYVQRECEAFVAEAFDGLGCRSVPATSVVTRHAEYKTRQLGEAARVGFEIPPTLVTTDPDEFVDFYHQHDGKVITKVLEQLGFRQPGNDFGRFTQFVATRDAVQIDAVRLCPVIVQPYVAKALELRVTVVGRQVFAAEIHSQRSNRARVDWRRYDMGRTPYRAHRLPDVIIDRCLRLTERLGLCYGAIDLILTPEGQYVFLEINPDGQYLWIEQATGLPISEAICALLVDPDPHTRTSSPATMAPAR